MPLVYPTAPQAFKCVELCQMLSNSYRAIYFFRFDEVRNVVYIQAGVESRQDAIQVVVFPDSNWEFIDE